MYANHVPLRSGLGELENKDDIYCGKCSLFEQLMFEFGHKGIISPPGIMNELFYFYPVQDLT